jgi:glycosyltransferase involved in cell wall biosynthesis
MKLLIIGNDRISREYGGGQVYIKNIVRSLDKRGQEILYLFIEPKMLGTASLKQLSESPVKEYHVTFPSASRQCAAEESSAAPYLMTVFQDLAPDIIHAHGWKHVTALASELAGIPCIITAHHGGIVCPAGALLNADDAICRVPAGDDDCLKCCVKEVPGWRLWFPLLKATPLRLRLWSGDRLRRFPFILFLTPLGAISRRIRDKMHSVHEIGLKADRIIAPSPAIADALIRNGMPERKIVVMPHGIPVPQAQPLRRDFGSGPLRFLYVGRISRVKGLHIMLKAFAGLAPKTYELHIVGGAVTRPELRYLARLKRSYPSVNTVWHGSRPSEEITRYIAWCDVMVHPAICLEIFGLTIAEALAVGRPVIATRCGGAEAQIDEGENGLLVPPNDSPALRQALRSVIDDPALVRKLATRSGNVISIETHVSALECIYQETLVEYRQRKGDHGE